MKTFRRSFELKRVQRITGQHPDFPEEPCKPRVGGRTTAGRQAGPACRTGPAATHRFGLSQRPRPLLNCRQVPLGKRDLERPASYRMAKPLCAPRFPEGPARQAGPTEEESLRCASGMLISSLARPRLARPTTKGMPTACPLCSSPPTLVGGGTTDRLSDAPHSPVNALPAV